MKEATDALYHALTALDRAIVQQRKALATVGALMNLAHLQIARRDVIHAQTTLGHFRGDAPPEGGPHTVVKDGDNGQPV